MKMIKKNYRPFKNKDYFFHISNQFLIKIKLNNSKKKINGVTQN